MNEDKSAGDGEEHGGDDETVRRARDLATSPPPKSLDTVTAASEAVEKVDAQGAGDEREHRVRIRAYELWEQDGRTEGSPTDFWLQAEADIAREDAQD